MINIYYEKSKNAGKNKIKEEEGCTHDKRPGMVCKTCPPGRCNTRSIFNHSVVSRVLNDGHSIYRLERMKPVVVKQEHPDALQNVPPKPVSNRGRRRVVQI